jgi:hypothetical protein
MYNKRMQRIVFSICDFCKRVLWTLLTLIVILKLISVGGVLFWSICVFEWCGCLMIWNLGWRGIDTWPIRGGS